MDRYVLHSCHLIHQPADGHQSKPTSSDTLRNGTPKPQSTDLASTRTQNFVQEPPKDGNILVTLPDQTTNVDARRREMKVEMMEYIAEFDHEFRR